MPRGKDIEYRSANDETTEPYFTLPTTQVDLARRQAVEAGEDQPVAGSERSFAVKGNDLDGYVGVSPEYQTYGDKTQKPLMAEGDGPEAVAERRFIETLSTPKEGYTTPVDEPVADDEDEGEKDDTTPSELAPVTPPAAPAKD